MRGQLLSAYENLTSETRNKKSLLRAEDRILLWQKCCLIAPQGNQSTCKAAASHPHCWNLHKWNNWNYCSSNDHIFSCYSNPTVEVNRAKFSTVLGAEELQSNARLFLKILNAQHQVMSQQIHVKPTNQTTPWKWSIHPPSLLLPSHCYIRTEASNCNGTPHKIQKN